MTYTLITGASSGIGREFALIAARDGRSIVAVARGKKALDTLAAELAPAKIITINMDLSTSNAAYTLAASLEKQNIQIDTLINNAGFGDYGEFQSTDELRQHSMINLNVTTLTLLTRLLLPNIIKSRGRILNVGSVAGFLPGPYMSVYYATKAYVLVFSESLAAELKPHGVSVTCLAPGPTATGFAKAAHLGRGHAIGRTKVTPADVAAYGWQSMLTGKTVAVHGVGNRFGIFSLRLLPRSVVRWAMSKGNRDTSQ